MSKCVHIGIDPGKSGGITFITPGGKAVATKMPDTLKDLYELLRDIDTTNDAGGFAMIELVHSSPQMGVKSAFTFGQGFGRLEMALTALCIPFEYVSPQKWQKAMSCLSRGDKNVTKQRAQQLFPSIKVTHGIADSLLIAEYGRRFHV